MLQARVHLVTLDPAELDASVTFAETVPGGQVPLTTNGATGRRCWCPFTWVPGGRVRRTGGSEFWREAAALGPTGKPAGMPQVQ